MISFRQGSTCVLTASLFLVGCSGGSGGGGSASTSAGSTAQREVTVTAGLEALNPSPTDRVSPTVDLQRLGLTSVDAVYDLSTPADTPFAFNVFARQEGNAGAVTISMAHAADNGGAPVGDVTSVAEAGIVPSGSGASASGLWLSFTGDGFARLSIEGRIGREQVLAFKTENAAGVRTALVRLRLGPVSAINVDTTAEHPCPTVTAETTLYSSDSWRFGLPTVAISGDRTSVVVYEGDDNDPHGAARYEMRLQYDQATGQVTGGGSTETSPDSGNWRDHEIAALYNVLAVVHGGGSDVNVALSFDRGATFAQTEGLATGLAAYRQRLVQVAMAADYSMAVTYWRAAADARGELMLVEGRPAAYDAGGSPTAYAFDAPVVLHDAGADVTPLLMGICFSEGGDLVVGYGYSQQTAGPNGVRQTKTAFRCAVRLFGSPTFDDALVDEELIESVDPSVSLLGQGSDLQIFYAYESATGVKLKVSADAGATFSSAVEAGDATAFQPSVLVRDQGGAARVDLLFLQRRDMGLELRVLHWDDHDGASKGQEYTLAASSSQPLSGGSGGIQVTGVAWLGYDATLDGDDVVVVYDEHTYDAWAVCGPIAIGAQPMSASFGAAAPPPLAPGMTQPVAAPDAGDQHQLKFLRLD